VNGEHIRESAVALLLLGGWIGIMLFAMRHCS